MAAAEIAAPPVDFNGTAPLWYEDVQSLDCAKAPEWCKTESYRADVGAEAK